MREELNTLLDDLAKDIKTEKTKEVLFPIDFYPKQEQSIMKILHESKGLSMQHLGIGMLPIFSRIYSQYKGEAFNGAFDTVPVFWVSIVDQPGSNKSESVKAWYNQLKSFNNYDDAENPISYTSNDTTPEGLIHNMKGQDNGLYLFYDEITSFTGGIGQYKKNNESDKAFWLSLWGGGDVTQFRVNGGIRHMKAQSISIAGTTQPDTLNKAFSNDLTNGFFDRFLWSVEANPIPDISENPDYDIDERVNIRLHQHIDAPKFNGKVKYSPNAKSLLIDWYNERKNDIGDDSVKRQFFGKDIIYINRFSLLTSVLYNMGDTVPISLESAERAIKLYEFCNVMRDRAYKIVTDEYDTVTESMLTMPSVARWIAQQKPGINKTELADLLGLNRKIFYR